MKISKVIGLLVLCFLMACHSGTSDEFQGTITVQTSTDMSGASGLMGGLMGNASPGLMSQTQDLHIDVPNARIKVTTTINSEGAFPGSENLFTTFMVDFKEEYIYMVNETDKQYLEFPADDFFTSEDTPSQIPFDMNEVSSFITKTDEEKELQGYSCNKYEIDMPIPLYKIEEVYLSPELFNKIKPILTNIPFAKNVLADLPEIGWPMSVKVDIMGMKSSYETTKVDEHKISDDLFNLDGYELISFLDYSGKMMKESMKLMENNDFMENIDIDSIQAMFQSDSIQNMMDDFIDQMDLDDILGGK